MNPEEERDTYRRFWSTLLGLKPKPSPPTPDYADERDDGGS